MIPQPTLPVKEMLPHINSSVLVLRLLYYTHRPDETLTWLPNADLRLLIRITIHLNDPDCERLLPHCGHHLPIVHRSDESSPTARRINPSQINLSEMRNLYPKCPAKLNANWWATTLTKEIQRKTEEETKRVSSETLQTLISEQMWRGRGEEKRYSGLQLRRTHSSSWMEALTFVPPATAPPSSAPALRPAMSHNLPADSRSTIAKTGSFRSLRVCYVDASAGSYATSSSVHTTHALQG